MTAFRITVLASLLISQPAMSRDDVTPWTPIGIASDQFESHAAFDPVSGDILFVRSGKDFSGWRILTSHCSPMGWTQPVDAPFAGDGVEADPWFDRGGRGLWFISTRSTDGVRRKDLDVWHVGRDAQGHWGVPERLPAPVNSTGNEWFPRVGRDGWLYFGSDRPGGLGKTDIWRARRNGKQGWRVENAGPALNGPGDEYEALPAPDGRSMILMASDGLYLSHATRTGWSKRVKLSAAINATGSEIGALFSPSGKSLMFARDLKGQRSGEFFVWHIHGREAWPPSCPGAIAR